MSNNPLTDYMNQFALQQGLGGLGATVHQMAKEESEYQRMRAKRQIDQRVSEPPDPATPDPVILLLEDL